MSWPLQRVDTSTFAQMDTYPEDRKEPDVEVMSIRSDGDSTQVVGSADMFDENGNVRLIPVCWLLTAPRLGKESTKLTFSLFRCLHQIQRVSLLTMVVSQGGMVD